MKNSYHKKESRWKWRLLAALGAFITACTVVLIPGCSGRQEEYPDGETEETTTADEEKNTVEEENRTEGRTPDVSRLGRNVCTYDPEDTIYYKTYYDDFVQGKIMHIDYTPRMEIRKELEDYFTDASGIRCLDNLAGMFYDDRTIETDEKELEQLFWEHGYLIDFCRGDFGDCHVRFVEITEMDGLSLYPVRILMQTWDEEHIYLQDITGPIPRKIKEVMTVERNGARQLVVHSTGLSREYVSEEELSFWEQSGTCWILVPMELEIDVSHAHNMGSLYPDIDRKSLYEAFFYRDGIAYRPSLQPFNEWGDRAVFRLGVMEIVEENKSFRLNAVCDVEGKTDSSYGYILFKIAEKPENPIFEDFGEMDYALFLASGMGFGQKGDSYVYGLYGDFTGTAQEGERLYLDLCSKMLPKGREEGWSEYGETYIMNLSPDLEWLVERRYQNHEGISEYYDTLLRGGEIMEETEIGNSESLSSYQFIKTGEGAYASVSSETHERMEQLVKEAWGDAYIGDMETTMRMDEYGRTFAVSQPDNGSIGIYSVEDLSLERLVKPKGVDTGYRLQITQFVGDGESGWLLFTNGADAWRYEYPSGRMEKIGEFMFDVSYSPDGKYLAYCTGNAELFRDVTQQAGAGDDEAVRLLKAWEETAPGWYVRELETEKVTYIPIDTGKLAGRYFTGGSCVWLEKDKLEKEIALTEEIVTDAPMGLAQSYGYYRITQFWPYDYYDALKYDRLPLEEADMMLGRIVEIQEDLLVTCDSFRSLGARGGREAFDRNYNIERIAIESPNYVWEEFIPDTAWYEEFSEGHYFMEKPEERDWQEIEEEYYQGIEGKFSVLVAGPVTGRYGENEYYHEYYVKKDGILMYSELTGNFFYLEKLDGKPEGCEEERGMTEEEKEIILQEALGIYTVTEFLPTKFYPGLDCAGDVYLPEEEADMMIGKEIIMESELYVTFNNGRWPNSEFMNRKMDDFILSRTEIEKPVYRIEERNRNDIYGLRDDMLPGEMMQDRYMEVSVYPGFGVNGKELPRLYLLHDGRIIMYAMSEYFLLEKQD